MIHIAKDSIINQFSTKDKLDFFQLVANQLNETENVIIPKLALKGLEIVDSTKIDTVKNSLRLTSSFYQSIIS